MEVSFSDLRDKEIINVLDGKKLGHIVDIVFNCEDGMVRGVFVPGEKKLFRKNEDIFVPLNKLKRIGDDVILVKMQVNNENLYYDSKSKNKMAKGHMVTLNNYYNEYNRETVYNRNNKEMQEGFNQNLNMTKNSYVRFKPIKKIKYK